MKKIFICLLMLLVVAFGLVGCGSKYSNDPFPTLDEVKAKAAANTKQAEQAEQTEATGTPNFDVPDGGYDGSEVTITFYHTMGSNLRDVLEKYIEKFYEIYPNITIEHKQVGGYDDVKSQVSTEITTGAQPNIAYCYPDHVALYNLANAVVTLDNLIDSTASDGNGGQLGLSQEQKDDFIEGYYNEGRQFGDGLMYSMPFSKSTEVLYYNKTFFEEHNLEVPTHWFSTDANDTKSLEYVCAKIKEIDSSSIPLGYDSEANWFITMCEQIGTNYTTADSNASTHFIFDDEYNMSIFNEFRTWFKNKWITTQAIYGTYTSGLFTSDQTPKSYMSIGSSAGATHQRPEKVDNQYPFEVGIAPIPQMNEENPKVISQGPSVCIFKKDNPQEVIASWLFVKYLTTSVEFQAEFSKASGYVPVIKSVNENTVYKNWLDKADGGNNIAALSAKVCLEQADYYYTSPAFNGSSMARDQVGKLVPAIFALDDSKDIYSKIRGLFADAIAECQFYAE